MTGSYHVTLGRTFLKSPKSPSEIWGHLKLAVPSGWSDSNKDLCGPLFPSSDVSSDPLFPAWADQMLGEVPGVTPIWIPLCLRSRFRI